MAMSRAAAVLKAMAGKKLVFSGKFQRGEEERLKAMTASQQGEVLDDLNAAVDFLVLADLNAGVTIQKKAQSLNGKGATIQVVDAAALEKMVEPTVPQLVQLLHMGQAGAEMFNAVTAGKLTRYGGQGIVVNIAGESFAAHDLTGFHLSDVRFEHCSFAKSRVAGLDLGAAVNCDFTDADGSFIRNQRNGLTIDDAPASCFVRAKLTRADIHGSMAGADFSGAQMENAELSFENIYSALNPNRRKTGHWDAGVVFAKTVLRSAQLAGLELKSPNFQGADLGGVVMTACDFESPDFRGANLQGATILKCNFKKADFTGANLASGNLADSDISGAVVAGADLSRCNLNGTTTSGVDFSKARNYDPNTALGGTKGPALADLDDIVKNAKRVHVTFLARASGADEGEACGVDSSGLKWGWGITVPSSLSQAVWAGGHRSSGPVDFSEAMLKLASFTGTRKVRFETLEVTTTKSPKQGKELRDIVLKAVAEAFVQDLPKEEELEAATQAYREKVREAGAAQREEREKRSAAAAKAKVAEVKKIEKKIAKEVGKVTDIASFLKALELRADKEKIKKATSMLKASGFQLFNDVTETHMAGVVKSQTDADLVYACRISSDGKYACCTQNLNICGGLRGSICKHLLVLIIGLVKAEKLDPTTIDTWVAGTHNIKPDLNKETMGEIFIRYKGAEAGEVDWRPTETVPEDYYAL